MKVSPSILTGDFARLDREVAFVADTGADMLHLDVMDGSFVPNLTFGAPVIRCLRPLTTLPFDVHLMMQRPDRLLDAFLDAGADWLTIHVECDAPIAETLRAIRAAGKRAGLSLRPGTPAEAVFPYLDLLDIVLVMTVEPGFGGQSFQPAMLPKIAALRAEIDRRGLPVLLQIDGGINEINAPLAAEAGADSVVVGNALFQAADPKGLVAALHAIGV